jgi:tetratricopeptide (TPR) repeat protein
VNRFPAHLLLLACLLLTGCATFFAPADPRSVEEIVSQAEDMVRRKAYGEAIGLYARAIAKQPDNGSYYLRRSELLEALGRDREARANYKDGLSVLAKGSSEQIEVMYRLALLSAEHMQDIDTAEELLPQLPPGSLQRLDLAGCLYFLTNQPEEAIKVFNQALAVAQNSDQKASVLYHAALIYHALSDEKNTTTSLFLAINNATHLGLIHDISAMWSKVNADQPLPPVNQEQ